MPEHASQALPGMHDRDALLRSFLAGLRYEARHGYINTKVTGLQFPWLMELLVLCAERYNVPPVHALQGAEHFADFASRRAGQVVEQGMNPIFESLQRGFACYRQADLEGRRLVVQRAIVAAEALQAAGHQQSRPSSAEQQRVAPLPPRTTPSAHAATEASTSGRQGQSGSSSGSPPAPAGQQARGQQAGLERHTLAAAAHAAGRSMQGAAEQPGLDGREAGAGAGLGQQSSVGFTSARHRGIRLMSAQRPAAGQPLTSAELSTALLEAQPPSGGGGVQGSSPGQPLVGEEEEFSVGGPGGAVWWPQ